MSLYTSFDHYNPPIGPDGTPYEYFEALRDEAIQTERPIGWSEVYGGFWVVTGWPEAREIMRNTEVFSNADAVTFPPYATPDSRPLMLSGHDEPDHMRYRKFLQSQFSPGKAQALGEQLRWHMGDIIDGFIDTGRVDVVDAYTGEIPARLTALMGGLPIEHAALYKKWVHSSVQVAKADPAATEANFAELNDYFHERLEHWRSRPGDDYMTMVAQQEVDGERLTDIEVRDLFYGLLLGAIDNTFYLMSSMFWRLAWDRELRRRLARKPELLPTAIDEFLRFYSPGIVCRLTTERVTVGGVTMEPGQHVVLYHPIENRDPREFPSPDVFDPERSPNRHFALGLGIHRCLGMHIVRVEVRVAVEEFLKRIPEFELDPELKPRWYAGQVGGMSSVPIVFPPGGGQPPAQWSAGRPLALA